MSEFVAEITVTLLPVVNDPQGLVVRDCLRQLGFDGVGEVRIGKHIEVRLTAPSEAVARSQIGEMCERLLRNQVIEDSRLRAAPAGIRVTGRPR